MSWSAPKTDLRSLLSDGATDHYRYRKRCFGLVNGTNTTFKTFEFRRIATFVGATAPLGTYVDGTHVTAATDNIEMGEFTLTVAPTEGSVVEATYYYQWFKDAELDLFLKNATQWLLQGEDPTQIPSGLQPAALHYAAQEAYLKLSMRWAERMSDSFLLEDAPSKEVKTAVDTYKGLAEFMMKKSKDLRDEFYTRSGQNLQPLFGVVSGRVKDVVPRR